MKHLLMLIFLGFCTLAKADHITGGEMFYSYSGMSNGQHRYHVTLKQFRSCNTANRQFYNPAYVGIFNRRTGDRITDIRVPLQREEQISMTSNDPCITRAPFVCYYVGYWEFDITVPPSPDGYILTSQVTFRIDAITNLSDGYGRIGATYTCEIPGDPVMANNSAHFTGTDLVTICAENSFKYSFAAEDADGDELRYYFCDAYQTVGYSGGGGGGGGNSSAPPANPPYYGVPYGGEFSGDRPLGSKVTIHPTTGLISGIAPAVGIYVVTVCVQEIRNGVAIATQRKDLQINITGCTIANASLQPEYMLCKNSQQLVIGNQSNSPLITNYYWEFSNSAGNVLYTSNSPVADYTFPTPGVYTVKLATNRGQQCPDSTESKAIVYPGFAPAFSTAGTCISKPVLFNDQTTTVHGVVNFWDWEFGEPGLQTDHSSLQNPSFTYPNMGAKPVRLITGNSVGCLDTLTQNINVIDKPPITLAYRDTLICPPDRLQLQATGIGTFVWSPTATMTDASSASPSVAPLLTTTYYVDLDQDGCVNRDSVTIRVVDRVSLTAPADTTICQGDPITLRPVSNGLHYTWTPAAQLSDPAAKNPVAHTGNTTTYSVTATISTCTATEQMVVRTVPYPQAFAGPDTTICFGTPAQLHATTDGNRYSWDIMDAGLNPIIRPTATTTYIFTAYDNKGCPKPTSDTITVTVLPKIQAFAGRDTALITGQPMQFNATGGTNYTWTPNTNLSNWNIPNPVATYLTPNKGIQYKVLVFNTAGCVDSAFINVRIYSTLPTVFVPTAFTPNGDGQNDQLRPIAAGMRELQYFMVYNRWGQLVFTSHQTGVGWDGRINGVLQNTGVFVWQVKGVDYLGFDYFNTGTATLIR